ncbi:MAG: bifunctional aspartate kinase/homoserine dehydrogenase I [Bacteroidetes bacterium]|nr:MAG: bifunctional aspartate kinase/homoserine dehydrogenase I [Bacteroidota bacterium]
MKIIKFGGKSLSNGLGIKNVISIIQNKTIEKEKFIVVLSARGNATDDLEHILALAQQNKEYLSPWRDFKNYQTLPLPDIDFSTEFNQLEKIFEGVQLIGDYSLKIKDLVLAQGEMLATKMVSALLNKKGTESIPIDSRLFFRSNSNFGCAQIKEELSKANTITFFNQIPSKTLPIVSGFIASDKNGQTTTLGRNGSNYSAALLSKYLNANELHNYTHVDGIYTANPIQVEDAQIIKHLNYQEANELANFGASILHAKTIIPLIENKIPLRILNTFNPSSKGTLISAANNSKEVKTISVQNDLGIIYIEGRGMLGKIGLDARIFEALSKKDISIGIISQGSSERSIGFVIAKNQTKTAVSALKKEFRTEINEKDISSISQLQDVSVITIVGQNLKTFSSSFQALAKNNIEVLLINNTLNGKNISLVVKNDFATKAVNVIHSQIFGITRKINIAIFGKGNVGGSLINQILKSQDQIVKRKQTKLNIFAIAGTKNIILDKSGVNKNWKETYKKAAKNESIQQVIEYASQHHLENLIAIDNTTSSAFVKEYDTLIEQGFDLVSSNKLANTSSFQFYKNTRTKLKQHNKQYLYETNVGAGLPLIDTIKLLHDSGENITRIRGVFSGSLSYLFNTFSSQEVSFSSVLKKAIAQGFTEPDPREDLCGNDVARKLLILARELDLENEFDDIQIKNLIPEDLRGGDTETFLAQLDALNPFYQALKEKQKQDHVLRYIGDLYGDLQNEKGILKVDLISVSKFSSLGQLTESDSIFEIYTESYGNKPIVIQGAGAGAEVTARGVFGDLLRITEKRQN